MKQKKIVIIIPVFNEQNAILSVIKDVKSHGYKNILIIDDGSSDDTSTLLKSKRVSYLRHIINRGKGAAMKTGFEASKLLLADIIVTMDGDGQHFAKDISKLIKKIELGNDVALGHRSYKKGQMPLIRIIFNKFANLATWVVYGILVEDSQSGFRAYSKNALRQIDTQSDGYEFDSEIIREIKRHKLVFAQVSITTSYTRYSTTKLKKQNILNSAKMLYRMFASLS